MKRKTYPVGIAIALALTTVACKGGDQAATEANGTSEAEASDLGALNGVWKADLASVKFEGKPDNFLLQGGTWTCSTCIPPLSSPADGQFHPVADRPYYDNLSVKIVDNRTVEFRRRKGDREVSKGRMQVSEDGNVLTNKFHDATTPGSEFDGETTFRRAAAAPSGAHAISGQWMPEKVGNYTEEALRLTYQINGNSVTSSIQGQTYTAEIGGPEVAVKNDPGGTTVAIAREGDGLKETYKRGGKEVNVVTVVPNGDGKSVAITITDPRDGSVTRWTANKAS